jgi:hypothetical protein
MYHSYNGLIKRLSKSLAKWKRDAEASYKRDTAMFEGLFHTVETNFVQIRFTYLY